MRPNWPARTAPAPPRATVASPTVARSERAQPKRVRALARRVRRVGRRGEPMAPQPNARGSAFLGDDRLHRGDGAVGKLDLDHVGADLAQGLLETDLTAVDTQIASVADRVGDLLGADRAEQLAVLAGALVDRQHRLGEQRGRLLFALGAGFLSRFGGSLATLCLLQRTGGRGGGQFAWNQVVPQIAGGD